MLPITLLVSLLLTPFILSSPTPVQPQGFSTLSTLSDELAKRADFSVTRNDLTTDPCQRVTVIFARGTTESGNVGVFAGPPFFNALEAMIGAQNVAVQGVDYAADIGGYLQGGDPAGAAKLASKANECASRCPNSQIVLSGYRYGFLRSPTQLNPPIPIH
jgi:Cutinase